MMEGALEMHSVMLRAMADPERDILLQAQTTLIKDKAKCFNNILKSSLNCNQNELFIMGSTMIL